MFRAFDFYHRHLSVLSGQHPVYRAESACAYLIFLIRKHHPAAHTRPRRVHSTAAGHAASQAKLLALEVNLVVLCDLFQRLEVL
jgi:hypothetical protein